MAEENENKAQHNGSESIPPKAPIRKTPGVGKTVPSAPDTAAGAPKMPNPIIRRPMSAPRPVPVQPQDDSGDAASQTAEITIPPVEDDLDTPSQTAEISLNDDLASPDDSEAVSSQERPTSEASASQQLNVLGSSSQTIHIQLPDEDSGFGAQKPVAPKPTSDVRPPAGPPTVKLKAPPTVRSKPFRTGIIEAQAKENGEPLPEGAADEAGSLKRSTSRIPLPSMMPPAGVPRPGSMPHKEGPKPMSPAQSEAAKRKTSRISLDAALSGTGEMEPSRAGAPKTIRLKRPVTATDPSSADADTTPTVVAQKETSRIPAEAAPDSGPPTQRKTIKVKRPSVSPTLDTESAQDPETDSGLATQAADADRSWGVPETVKPVFGICAIAATLVAVALIWVLAAHALGPNKSLTPLSSWPTGPQITVPGAVSVD